MSNLRFAAKVLMRQRQRLPGVITSAARLISTTAPKPNFGNHEMRIPTETMRIESTQLLNETPPSSKVGGEEKDNANKSDKASNIDDSSGDTNVGVSPKTVIVKDEMPAMTIVDINSGYGRMDFEERMNHMDLVDRLNDGKLPKNMSSAPMMPLVRGLPSIVNIDADSDEMMYEDKPEEEKLPASSPIISNANAEPAVDNTTATPTTATKITPNNSASGVGGGGGGDLVPISNEVVQATEAPETTTTATQQEAHVEATVKAVAANDSISTTTTTKTTAFADGVCIAPVDIDAFPKDDDDEEKGEGAVDIDAFGDEKRRKLPPIPKVRNNVFIFKGIKIIMPRRMLRDETYRYRLDPKDQHMPDDMQICTFEK